MKIVDRLRQEAPENKITLEADNYAQFEQMYVAEPDIIQLDKWSLEDVKKALDLLHSKQKDILLSIAGGVNKIMFQIMPNWVFVYLSLLHLIMHRQRI